MAQTDVIETTGEVVEEAKAVYSETSDVDIKDIPLSERPLYTVAKAIEWAKDPKNAPKIEEVVARARDGQERFVRKVDEEVSKVGRLIADMATDESFEDEVINHFLGTLIK